MKLFIAVPSNRSWSAFFGDSLVKLTKRLCKDNIDFEFDCLIGSSCLPKSRSAAIDMARERKATHLLFLDDDMAFPENIFEFLSMRDKPVIVANYSTKQAWDLKPVTLGLDGQRLSSKGKNGIERIKCGGLGMALINLEAIKHVENPLFSVMWDGKDYIGEDIFFFLRLEECGVEVWVDHSVSNKIAHAGEYCYGVQ